MSRLRFLHYFVHHRSGPDEIVLTQLEFSQRPGMHQPIEDFEGSPFTRADRKFLSQVGICSDIRGTHDGTFPNSKPSGETSCGCDYLGVNAASQTGSCRYKLMKTRHR